MIADVSHIYRGRAEKAEDRARLKAIIAARSFKSGGEVTLASGKSSTFYFDMKPTMLDPEGSLLLSELLLDAISGTNADAIGGLEMGAVPIASFMAPASFAKGKPLQAFFVRKQAKEHGTKSLIEGLAEDESLAGKRVIIVEDVTTTGGSALKAVEIVRAEGGEIAQIITLVDRQEGAVGMFREQGLPFLALFAAEEFRSSS